MNSSQQASFHGGMTIQSKDNSYTLKKIQLNDKSSTILKEESREITKEADASKGNLEFQPSHDVSQSKFETSQRGNRNDNHRRFMTIDNR